MKKIFVKVSTWLRSIVTTMMGEEGRVKREEVKDTQSVYVDVNVNDDVDLPVKEARISLKRSSLAEGESNSLLVRMEEYIEEHYAVRFNRLSQHYELSPLGTERWAKLDEETVYRLMMEMNHAGICITKPYLVRADRHNFGYYLKQLGAPQVRIRNRRLFGVALREAA